MTKYTHAIGSVWMKREGSRRPILYALLLICFMVVLVSLLHTNYHQSEVHEVLENMQGKELQLPKDGIAVSGGVFTNAMLRTVSIQSNEGDNKAKMDAGSSVTSSSPSTSTSTTSNDITPVVMSAPNSLRSRDDHIATPEKVVTEVVKPTLQLVSLNKPVQADVRGNLGPISVVTNENVEDWLADRWQAAKNMNGEPIPGPHWIEMDLQDTYWLRRFVIDWETAYSKFWTIEVKQKAEEDWQVICSGTDAVLREKRKQHIIQEVQLAGRHEIIVNEEYGIKVTEDRNALPALSRPVRFVRLHISMPSTQWGSSIWRFQVWGYKHPDE